MSEVDPNFVFNNRQHANNAVELIPKILTLLDREYVDKDAKSYEDDDILVQTIILTDEGYSLSSPDRIIELLQAIQQIYAVICEINGAKNTKIAVVGLDSGSEKSIDFLGVARFMHELRETLNSVYNMITFHKQNVILKNLQVAGETLSVISQIAKMEKSSALTHEDAQRLKHSLFAGVEKFASTGAYTPEMILQTETPALTMRPQPHLLTGPADSLVRDANDEVQLEQVATADQSNQEIENQSSNQNLQNEDELSEFSRAEIKQALALLQEAKRSTLPKRRRSKATSDDKTSNSDEN